MSWFTRLNPIPSFPSYSGSYQVGTIDVEVPAADLESPSPAPQSAPPTVAFRIFYPCDNQPKPDRPVRWIPQPQRHTVSAFAKFLGAGSLFADVFSLFPHLLYYIRIPAHRNAPLLSAPTQSKRWPVMVFSHGLAGSRNTYSHICGSLSSHGIVVIAMDHRDGSSPIQYIRATSETEAQIVDYEKYPHTPSPEVYEGRDKQLRIRLYELGLAHSALLTVDRGQKLNNLDTNTSHSKKEREDVLAQFKDSLDVHVPGRIVFTGHSFGAATTVQFVKSVFYSTEKPANANDILYSPAPNSELVRQITTRTPVSLLDLWCLPLKSPAQRWLWQKPLPAYMPGGRGGQSIVSVLSEGFFNWRGNFEDTKRTISPPFGYEANEKGAVAEPYFFYPANSQHFSQSDFGILFPYLTSKFLKAMEPERVLKLNTRAITQMLRENDVEVAATTAVDMEIDGLEEKDAQNEDRILARDGSIRGWISVDTTGRPAKSDVKVEKDENNAPADKLPAGQQAMEM